MLKLIFIILMFVVFGKLIMLAFKATWGIAKIVCSIVLLPALLIILAVCGLIYVALPILVIVGIITLFTSKI